MTRDIFEAIRQAARRGRGLRLSAAEVALLAEDAAIAFGEIDHAQKVAEEEAERRLRRDDKRGSR